MKVNGKLYSIPLASAVLILFLILVSSTASAATTTCSAVGTNYQYWSSEQYPLINLYEEEYVPLRASTDQIWESHVNKLASLLDDSNNMYFIRSGEQLDLGQGYTIEAKQIDVDGEKVWLEFQKDGEFVDDEIISLASGGDNTWEVELDDIQDEDDVVVFRVYVNQIFQDAVGNFVQIDGIWLIDYENAMTLKIGDKFGDYTLKTIINGTDEANLGSLVFEYVNDQPIITKTKITTSGSASDPHIYENKIVYEDSRNGKSDIYMYDLSNQQETQISTSGTAKYPAIYGDRIVWYDSRNGKCDVYMHDLSNQQETQISTSGIAYISYFGPEIYNDKIVWQEECSEYSLATNLIMHDLSTQQETQIATSGVGGASGTGYHGFAIHSDKIVAADPGGDDCSGIVMFDLSSQRTAISGGYYPDIYNDKIVWTDTPWMSNDWNIYMYDLSSQQETQITTSGTAFCPAIHGNRIVWWEDGIYGQDMYMYDLSNSKETQITSNSSAYDLDLDIYGDRIVWEDGGNGKSDIYLATLSSPVLPVANFSSNVTSGYAPLSVQFTDLSENATEWNWNFGDGSINSTLQNPTHTYSTAGNYTVALTASNVAGSSTVTGTVRVTPPEESEETTSEIEVSDNRLREASPDIVYKSSPYIDVGGINNVGRYRNVMLFNLSEYAGSEIKNATLSLYWYYPEGASRPNDTVIEIYRPASSWNPSYVSWNKKNNGVSWTNAGGDWYDKNGVSQGSTPYATFTIKGSTLPDNRYYQLNVTDLVKEYASGKYANTGFLIKARTENNNYIAFYSSDWTNENQKPKLAVTKKVPVVTVNATVTGAMDNRLRESSPGIVLPTSPYIDVGGMNNVRYRDVMWFNLSKYTGSAEVNNAALSLYWYYPEGKTRPNDTAIEVYRPASSWNPSYVSWNKKNNGVSWTNAGGDWYDKNGVSQGSTPYATITIKGSTLPDNKYYELNVTDLVKEYTSGKYANTGFLIKARTESNNYIAFYSSDCGNEKQVPKLQLVYS